MIKKHVLLQCEILLNKKNYSNIIPVNILDKYLNLNKVTEEFITYHNYTVLKNAALSRILLKNNKGIDRSEINCLIEQYPILENLKIGQTLFWSIIANQNLNFLIYGVSSQEIRIYKRVYTAFSEGIIRIIHQSNDRFSSKILFIGMLHYGTFIETARALGIKKDYVMNIIHALEHQLDFKKLQQGDKFSVLISVTIDDNYSIQTRFIGARLHTVGQDYYIFRANNGGFYDHKAMRLDENFIRFPVSKPFRISSNFNLHRLNPITRQISPHAGVDFAVPIGTPVFSIGDGVVVISAYSKISGNYVVIRHNYRCITRYMHLNKLLVKSGQKVKCGDSIALSGNTGRSTGPHLHFEMWIDCHPVNPLIVSLSNMKRLLGNERIIYLNQIKKILPQLCIN